MPRSLCLDVEPKSYLSLLYVSLRRLKRYPPEQQCVALSPALYRSQQHAHSASVGLRAAMESWYSSPSPVVYRRSPLSDRYNANVLDLRKLKKPQNVSTSLTNSPTSQPRDSTLTFESRFESGNLAVASKKSEQEYNLLLQNDTNSKGNTQWFYFKVGNTVAGSKVRFNILNLGKGGSLYSSGMKVLVLSEMEMREKGKGWHRDCEEIVYEVNNIRREGGGRSHYTLTFTYRFQYSHDSVYFAYSHPYTYSDLVEDLNLLESDPVRAQLMTRKELCRTLMGNTCEYVTISAPCRGPNSKKGVVISARVHPGETVGSWMMKGVLDFLTSSAYEAQILRENYVFKLVPMLNPDGVIHGNYRCGLAGADLNRRWKYPSKTLHPTVYYTKQLIKMFTREREVDLILDLHGHSRRHNIFMYGCPSLTDPSSTRLFPFILSKLCPFFSYPSCNFKLQPDKEQTQRITLFKETRIPKVYTLEATFSGMTVGPFSGQHLTVGQLQEMGRYLCIAVFVDGGHVPPSPQPQPEDYSEWSRETCKKALCEMMMSGQESEEGSGSSGSDSDPSEDNLDPEELSQLLPAVPMTKAQRGQKRPYLNRESSIGRNKWSKEETKEIGKCKICMETEGPGHVCKQIRVLKPLGNPYSRLYTKRVGLRTFVNPITGKTMHDQATQTPRQGTPSDSRSKSLPASVASSRESAPSLSRPSHDLRSTSQDRKLPAIAKGRETSAKRKGR